MATAPRCVTADCRSRQKWCWKGRSSHINCTPSPASDVAPATRSAGIRRWPWIAAPVRPATPPPRDASTNRALLLTFDVGAGKRACGVLIGDDKVPGTDPSRSAGERMPETPRPGGPGRFRRFWQNLGGQDPDLHLEGRWQKFMAFCGLHVPPPNRRDRLHLRPRFFKVLGAIAVALPLLLLGTAFKISTSPLLCNQCHIMKPYYQAWKTSKHNFVPCVDCHYPPGFRDTLWVKYQALSQVAKWATQTYSSKPFAEIEDASCLRSQCHATRLLQGKVTFKRGIIFDHRPHLEQPQRGRQLRCTSCHSQIVVGTHIEVTETTCFLCHFKGQRGAREVHPIGGCPLCHQPPKGDIQLAGGTVFNHRDFVDERGTQCQKW